MLGAGMFSQNLIRLAAGRVVFHRATCGYNHHPIGNELDGVWLDSFLAEYKIARNISEAVRAPLLRILLRERAAIDSLRENDTAALLKIFHKIARDVRAKVPVESRFSNFPSAISKLVWAMRPEVGILCDDYANKGLARVYGLDPAPRVSITNYDFFAERWADLWRSREFTARRRETAAWLEKSFNGLKVTKAFNRHLLDQCLVLTGGGAIDGNAWQYRR